VAGSLPSRPEAGPGVCTFFKRRQRRRGSDQLGLGEEIAKFRALQRFDEEKSRRRNVVDDAPYRKLALVWQIRLIRAQFRQPEFVRWLVTGTSL
jgi:hypothetical protein